MATTPETNTWLTQEAADRLSAELAYLENEGRSEIIKKIEAARQEGAHRPRGRGLRGSARRDALDAQPGDAAGRRPQA